MLSSSSHLPLRFKASNTSGTVTVIRRAPSVITPISFRIVLKKLVRAVLASSYVSMLILLTPADGFRIVCLDLAALEPAQDTFSLPAFLANRRMSGVVKPMTGALSLF